MTTNFNNNAIYEFGDKNNKALIFIHGFPFDAKMWKHQADYLSKYFYCISYDVDGLREKGNSAILTMESWVDDLFLLIDKLKLDKPSICGLSMGGYIALRAAERDDTVFSKMILCDTKSSADNDDVKIKRAESIKEIRKNGLNNFLDKMFKTLFAQENLNSKDYDELLKSSQRKDPHGVSGCLLAMAARTDTTDYLLKSDLPFLVLCGDDDKITPPDIMKEMSDKISSGKFVLVPNAGHLSPVENPSFVNEKIKDFLNG